MRIILFVLLLTVTLGYFPITEQCNTTGIEGTYGSAFQTPFITVNECGRITSATNVAISGNGGCVDVRNYGADPHDEIDDTVALQAAIDNESCIFLPNGTFYITSTLKIDKKDHFIMRGAGKGNWAHRIPGTSIQFLLGSGTETVIEVKSTAATDLSDFAIAGLNTGCGLDVTANNSIASSHFNYFHDIDIAYSDIGLRVGSINDDDISNARYARMLFVHNRISVAQLGSQTVNNFYEDCQMLEFKERGFWCQRGTVTLNGNAFYGSANATQDVYIDNNCLEAVFFENLHEVINNRVSACAYDFPLGIRAWQTTIRGARVITDSNYTTNYLVTYQQSGPLSIVDMSFGGYIGGSIYLDNQNAVTPQDLLFTNVRFYPENANVIKGNWNYQAQSHLAVRSYFASHFLDDSNATQDIFGDPFHLQDYTTYNIRGVIAVVRSAGTTSHQIQFLSNAGTASVIITLMKISTTSSSTSPTELVSALVATTYVNTAVTITATSSSTSEYNTIHIDGQIRTASTGAGTWIPQLQWTAAPGGTPSIRPNSFMEVLPIGNIGLVKVN